MKKILFSFLSVHPAVEWVGVEELDMEQPTSPPPAQRPHNGLNGAKKQGDSQKARHRLGKTIYKNL
jgi:hypothetical protein